MNKPLNSCFRSAHLLCVGSGRQQSPDFYGANHGIGDLHRHYFGGAIAGVSRSVQFEPKLNEFWSDHVSSAYDVARAPLGTTVFELDSSNLEAVVLSDKSGQNEEASWVQLEDLDERKNFSRFDFNSSFVLFLQAIDSPLDEESGEAAWKSILREINQWGGVTRPERYNDIIVCRSGGAGWGWDQLIAINLGPGNKECSDKLSIPVAVFELLKIMVTCATFREQVGAVSKHEFYKKSARSYFEAVRTHSGDLVDYYEKEFLPEIESWRDKRDDLSSFLNRIKEDRFFVNILQASQDSRIEDLGGDPAIRYGPGDISSVIREFEGRRKLLEGSIEVAEDKRRFVEDQIGEYLKLRMYIDTNGLTKNAIRIAVLALIVAVISLISLI